MNDHNFFGKFILKYEENFMQNPISPLKKITSKQMKKNQLYILFLLMVVFSAACKKSEYGNYPGGVINPYISIYDLKTVYKGTPVKLSAETLFGSENITGIITSDHAGKNIPEGLIILQDSRRLAQLRGIAVNIGADAAKYVPGDSVVVNVAGGTLERVKGITQITGVAGTAVTKVASGKPVVAQIMGSVAPIIANPDVYENIVVTLTQAELNPPATSGETFAGDKVINNGSGDFTLHTEAGATYASTSLPFLATYSGLLLGSDNGLQMWPRTKSDIIILSDKPPVITPVIITGFLTDPIGTDGNHEYIQLMATRDIDFAVTNMSIVVCNNANAATPGGVPVNGWAMGGTINGTRTYKINLTNGKALKGTYFYVGGNKLICGANTTDISSANWIVSKQYTDIDGDGFGTKTGNLLANSGNVAGIAVFNTVSVDSSTVPMDVIMYGGGGSNIFSEAPSAVGYKITNTDYYETQNSAVSTLDPQPFYRMGTNTFKFDFPTTASNANRTGHIAQLGGTYNTRSGKWPVKRTLTSVMVNETSPLSTIEGATSLTDAR